jgi:SAM-dependent methyltransferase
MLCGGEGVVVYAGLEDRLLGVRGTWELRRCVSCGLCWIDPMPTVEDLPRLYAGNYTHRAPAPNAILDRLGRAVAAARFGYPDDGIERRWLAAGWLLSLLGPARERLEFDIMSLTPPQGKLLDVGCGNGVFLLRMSRLGWEPHGVEPDIDAVRIARRHLPTRIHHGTLETARYADDSVDAITVNHVIEHVPDPLATLRECRRILRPGGRLMIATPNHDALGHRLFREDWLGLDVPRHLYLFDPPTLAASVRLADLSVTWVRTPAARAYWIWKTGWTLRAGKAMRGPDPEAPSIWLSLSGFGFWAVEHLASRTNRRGEEVWLLATKR